jgi:hypothetical protein
MPESTAGMDEQYEETRRLNAQDPVLENYQKNKESDRLDVRPDAMRQFYAVAYKGVCRKYFKYIRARSLEKRWSHMALQ